MLWSKQSDASQLDARTDVCTPKVTGEGGAAGDGSGRVVDMDARLAFLDSVARDREFVGEVEA